MVSRTLARLLVLLMLLAGCGAPGAVSPEALLGQIYRDPAEQPIGNLRIIGRYPWAEGELVLWQGTHARQDAPWFGLVVAQRRPDGWFSIAHASGVCGTQPADDPRAPLSFATLDTPALDTVIYGEVLDPAVTRVVATDRAGQTIAVDVVGGGYAAVGAIAAPIVELRALGADGRSVWAGPPGAAPGPQCAGAG